MALSSETHIKQLYHTYRHTADIDRKGLFFSTTCLQICRPVPSYAATTRVEIVQYLKDAQAGNVPNDDQPNQSTPFTQKVDNEVTDQAEAASDGKAVMNKKDCEDTVQEKPQSQSVYTIRALRPEEHEFSTSSITSNVGLKPSQLLQKSKDESWIGMRVDLWDQDESDQSLLVKVQYWWRKEAVRPGEELDGDDMDYGWRQCLHDIMYLGPKDGSEGKEGLEVLQ